MTQEKDFFNKIKEATENGYGFIPLIGSGLSYQSGIMLGSEISRYLAYVYAKFFVLENLEKFDLGIDGWPQAPQEQNIVEAETEILNYYDAIIQCFGLPALTLESNSYLNSGHPTSAKQNYGSFLYAPGCPEVLLRHIKKESDEKFQLHEQVKQQLATNQKLFWRYPIYDQELIKEIGLRSLYSWTVTLNFFSRLTYDREHEMFVLHENEDPAIIDSFNAAMVGVRKPNQNHYLLAHLLDPLNIRTILTTNFDTLIEDAIREKGERVTLVSLEKESTIPRIITLRKSLAVIKLHGDSHRTRADESINEPPTEKDREHFLEYFYPKKDRESIHVASHLLVMGTSLSDKRTVELIRHVLILKSTFTVFIITQSTRSTQSIKRRFGTQLEGRLIFSTPQQSEYALYELYQRQTLNLPPGGFHYQFAQYSPPYPGKIEGTKFEDSEEIKNFLVSLFLARNPNKMNASKYRKAKEYGVIIKGNIIVLRGKYGVTRTLADTYFDLQNKRQKCIWIETEDYNDTSDLAADIVQAILYEFGKIHHKTLAIDFTGAILEDDFKEKMENYLDRLNVSPEKWVFFIFDRNRAGECASFTNEIWSDEYKLLFKLIERMAGLGFKIIYAPKNNTRIQQSNDTVSVLDERKSGGSDYRLKDGEATDLSPLFGSNHTQGGKHLKNIGSEAEAKLVAESLKKHIQHKNSNGSNKDTDEFMHFLYGIALFRQSRHLNATISEAVYPCPLKFNTDETDNDDKRWKQVSAWRNELTNMGVILKKPGGYAWKHRDIRIGICSYFENCTDIGFKYKSRTNLLIGDWYNKAFYATQHETPFREAIYHWTSAIKTAHLAEPFIKRKEDTPDMFRCGIILRAMLSIAKILRVSRQKIPCSLNQEITFAPFSEEVILKSLEIENKDYNSLVEKTMHYIYGDGNPVNYKIIEDIKNAIIKAIKYVIYESREYEMLRDRAQGMHAFGSELINVQYSEAKSIEDLNIETRDQTKNELIQPWHFECKNENILFKKLLKNFTPLAEDPKKSKFTQILKKFFNFISKFTASNDNSERHKLIKLRRELRDQLVYECFEDPAKCLLWIKSWYEATQNLVGWANAVSRSYQSLDDENTDPETRVTFKNRENRCIVVISVFCTLTTDMSRFLPPSMMDSEAKILLNIHRLYGLSLGKLGRFTESFRRLNEAESFNFLSDESRRETNLMSINQAKIDVIIHQEKRLFNKFQEEKKESESKLSPNEQRRLVQLIDKAYFLIDSTEISLTGKNSLSYWRDRLCILRLRLYCVYLHQMDYLERFKPKMLFHAPRIDIELYRVFNDGLIEVNNKAIYRKMIYADLFYFGLLKYIKSLREDKEKRDILNNLKGKCRFSNNENFSEMFVTLMGSDVKNVDSPYESGKHEEFNDDANIIYKSVLDRCIELDDIYSELPYNE